MTNLHLFWSHLGPETKAALIGAISTLGVGVIGFGGLILQLRSQSKQSRDAVAENERRRLKAAMYEDAVAVCRALADASIELANSLRIMGLQVQYAARAHEQGQLYDLPAARYPILLQEYSRFSDATLNFIFLVENRRIIDPRILIFRTAMSVVLHDTRKLMHLDFVANVMTSIPAQLPDGNIFPYTPPTVEHAALIKQLCDSFVAVLDDGVAYTEDFLVELQNNLLGDLFEKKVQHRKPVDRAKKVITFQDAPVLEQWFETSTEWGREVTTAEAEAAAKFNPEEARSKKGKDIQ